MHLITVNRSRKRSGFRTYILKTARLQQLKGMQSSAKGVTFLSKMLQCKRLDLREEPSPIKLC